MNRFFRDFFPWILLVPFLCVAFVLTLLCSCSRVNYVPVETVHTDSVYITKYNSDSTYLKDSIYLYIGQKDDTVYRTEYRYKIHYRDRISVDTIFCERIDSVQVPYPVEKKLTRWQQWKQEIGGWSTFIIIITLLFVVGKRVYKLIK